MALALLLASPALAVVGGAPESGPLAKASVMVLGAGGGVCSAVLVAPDALLTAAHCAGGGRAARRVHLPGGGLIEPAAIAVHPGYRADAVAARTVSVDLALIRLPGPLPAPWSPATLGVIAPAKGAALTLGGYGLAREGDGASSGVFRAARLRVVEPYGRGRVLVWASGEAGVGACAGDSGGPLASPDGAVFAVAGWSRGTGETGGCGALSQGVLLGPQRAWIDGVLAGWGAKANWR